MAGVKHQTPNPRIQVWCPISQETNSPTQPQHQGGRSLGQALRSSQRPTRTSPAASQTSVEVPRVTSGPVEQI